MKSSLFLFITLFVFARAHAIELPLSEILKTGTKAQLRRLLDETNRINEAEARCHVELSLTELIPASCYKLVSLRLKFRKISNAIYRKTLGELDLLCQKRYISGLAQVRDPKLIPSKSSCRKLSESLYMDQQYREEELVQNL